MNKLAWAMVTLAFFAGCKDRSKQYAAAKADHGPMLQNIAVYGPYLDLGAAQSAAGIQLSVAVAAVEVVHKTTWGYRGVKATKKDDAEDPRTVIGAHIGQVHRACAWDDEAQLDAKLASRSNDQAIKTIHRIKKCAKAVNRLKLRINEFNKRAAKSGMSAKWPKAWDGWLNADGKERRKRLQAAIDKGST